MSDARGASPAPWPEFDGVAMPPLALLLRWLEHAGIADDGILPIAYLPAGNGSLPDLLRLGGIARVRPAPGLLPASFPAAFRWEGAGGARVQVGPGDDPRVHHGTLPIAAGADVGGGNAIHALIDLARLEDAAAATGHGSGASWPHVLCAAGVGQMPRVPVPARLPDADGAHLGAWNPLPFARWLTVALPVGARTPPWGVIAADGVQHPVQVVEGALGRELLVALRLGALACTTLAPLTDPVPGAHWEVDATVIDNGRVRAEFDALGQVTRLCWNGVFADLAGPAVQPLIDGEALAGAAVITVLEVGPVRARIGVTRACADGTLHIVYSLHAHEDHLRVTATWDGEDDIEIDHPTAFRAAHLHAAGEGARWVVAQAADVARPTDAGDLIQAGVRWAALGDGGGRGVALCAARPASVSARSGHLRIAVPGHVAYALAAAKRPSTALNLGQVSSSLGTPGRAYDGAGPRPAPFRLADLRGLAPLWVRRPDGCAGELVFAEQAGCRGRAFLHPAGSVDTAWRVDARGRRLAPLAATPEGDGFVIDYGAGEILIVRWG